MMGLSKKTSQIKALKLDPNCLRYTDPTPTTLQNFAYVEDIINAGVRPVPDAPVKCALRLEAFKLFVLPLRGDTHQFNMDNSAKLFKKIKDKAQSLDIQWATISIKPKSCKINLKIGNTTRRLGLEFDNEKLSYEWAIALKKNAYAENAQMNLKNFYTMQQIPVNTKTDMKRGVDDVTRNKLKIATDNLTGEQVVVRVLSFKYVGEKRALRQAKMLGGCLNHPNIVKTYDIFSAVDKMFIVQELVEGGKLFTCMEACSFVSEVDVSRIIRQALAGLAYLHERHIVHGCVNPSTIAVKDLSDPSRRIKLIEFFNSIDLSGDIPSSDHLRAQYIKAFGGNHFYMPPELLDQSKEFYPTTAIDIWCIGVTAFWMLSGKLPFTAESAQDYQNEIKEGPRFVEKHWVAYSDEARQFITSILKEDPNMRPDVFELLDHPWIIENDAMSRSTIPTQMDELNRKSSAWSKVVSKMTIFSGKSKDSDPESKGSEPFVWKVYEPESGSWDE